MVLSDGQADIGVIHGRFQIFHSDHLRYALAAKQRCRQLIVGLTSPDPRQAPTESAAPHRSDAAANPLTYYERQAMITACLREAGVARDEFSIVPFPIEQPERLANYTPRDATYYLTVNDAWGDEKVRRLHCLGLTVNVLWRTDEKAISGTRIRALMAGGGPWRDLVPPATAAFVDRNHLADRIARLALNAQESR
jgi:nicotinamide mononucleotide adenylyltransferase